MTEPRPITTDFPLDFVSSRLVRAPLAEARRALVDPEARRWERPRPLEADGRAPGASLSSGAASPRVTVALAEHVDGTRLVLHQTGATSVAARDADGRAWLAGLERLAELVAGPHRRPTRATPASLQVETPTPTTIVMTRPFQAPRTLVWCAMVEPDRVRRWLFAPPGWVMTVCEGDTRVGGTFRWEWADETGRPALEISGVNTEVAPPHRIAHTETMEMGECGVIGTLFATVELAEHGGVTHMTMTLLFGSQEARDGALASGMEHGMEAGYGALDALLAARS